MMDKPIVRYCYNVSFYGEPSRKFYLDVTKDGMYMYYEAMTKRKVFGGTGWNTHEGFEEAQRRFSNCFVNRGMRVKKIDLYHTEEL